jgi:hypothetical protein
MSPTHTRSAAALAVGVLVISAATALAPTAAEAKKKEAPIESYSAFVISSTPGARMRARLSINRWSTDEERAHLLEVLQQNDPKAFADELGKLERVGTFQFADTGGYTVRYARKFEHEDGSWQIIAGTDKPLSARDLVGTDTEAQYYLAIIEINSDPDGVLQAVVSPGSELVWDEENEMIDLKNWAGMVYGLSHVRRIK